MATMWATAEDVLARWIGDDAPSDVARIARWVEDAEAVITAEFPGIAARITADNDLGLRARIVVARMVTRAFRNPTGMRQVNEQTGPYGLSGTYAGQALGSVNLDDDDRALLSGLPGRNRQRAFTINTVAPYPDPNDPPWWVTPQPPVGP